MSRFDQDRFDPAPDPDLVCCICQAVLDCPLETPCRHVFCKICIETWLSSHQTCPTCRKHTQKEDLRPVLPIIQNMVNRLQMKCKNYDRGCINTIPLENIDTHEVDCGYEQLHCRFKKCGKAMLKRDRQQHEEVLCKHREIRCTKDCGLMIPVKEVNAHDCLNALKARVAEQDKLLHTLQQRAVDLTSLRDSLEQQLGSVERKLEEAVQRLRRIQEGSVSDQLSDFNDDASTRTWNTEYTLDGLDDHSVVSNNTDISLVVDDPAASPVDLLLSSQDSARRSTGSDSTDDNSPVILFSSSTRNGVRVNVQGNASLSYASRDSQGSGSETSGFIAESSGYDQSPIHDLDRLFSSTENESDVDRPASSEEQRPASPEPPYSMNNSSDDADADSIVQESRASPVQSHYSLHTMSDSDTADAVRDILNITPPHRSPVQDSTSPATSTPKVQYRLGALTPTTSADGHSDVDDLKGFSSSDDVSDDDASDREVRGATTVRPFYSSDMISDDGHAGFVNNSPAASGVSVEESFHESSENSFVSKQPKRRGFLSSDSDSANSVVSDHSQDTKIRIRGITTGSDVESSSNKSNNAFSLDVVSSIIEEQQERLNQDLPSPQPPHSTSPRSRKQSGESEQGDVQSLLDQFVEENVVSETRAEDDNKDDNSGNEEQIAKSLDKLTEALEEMADEMESKLRNERNNPVASRDIKITEAEDDTSDIDMECLVNDHIHEDEQEVDSLSLRDHLPNNLQHGAANISSILNSSDSSIVEIKGVMPSQPRAVHSRMGKEMPKREDKPASDSQRHNNIRSRTTRQTVGNVRLPSTSREQDRHIELLEEQYALRRENKNLDVERYVSHVQRMMSSQGGEVKRENHGIINKLAGYNSDTRATVKRKCDQQPGTTARDVPVKKPKHETVDRSERPSRNGGRTTDSSKISLQSESRTETMGTDSVTVRPTTHSMPYELAIGSRQRRSISTMGLPSSSVSFASTSTASRKTDKKHTWDPKKLNISLNVAINLDKAARGRDQTASAGTSNQHQSVERPQSSRRSAPPVLKQRERSVQDRVKTEGSQQLKHRGVKSERPNASKDAASGIKTERLSDIGLGKGYEIGRLTSKATCTISKPPPTATITHPTHASRRPRRHAAPSTFTREPLSDSDSSSNQDVNWEPVGNEPSDVSISSSENEEEGNTDYKLKIPIPTATLLEKYKDCDDSDDSWSPTV